MSMDRSICTMVKQGYSPGSCKVKLKDGTSKVACKSTLRHSPAGYERVIKSLLLSRPEDYLSIYQSGCNHDCLKCHSHEFSKVFNGQWMNTDHLANFAKEYYQYITVFEPKFAATSWHAQRLCKHCGSCVITGKKSPQCPNKLRRDQVVFSPQGFGPARNIVAFTGGDILCKPEFYVEVTRKIKSDHDDLFILLETNGFGLTPTNLEAYASGGIDSFWLDIKAFSNDKYKKLCGPSNQTVIESIQNIKDLGFTLEILTLYIPGMVETDEHSKIAKHIAEVDKDIPTTLLAFFPCYKLLSPFYRAPNKEEMVKSFIEMKNQGLSQIRMGNLGVFAKTEGDYNYIDEKLKSYEYC